METEKVDPVVVGLYLQYDEGRVRGVPTIDLPYKKQKEKKYYVNFYFNHHRRCQ